MEGTEGGLTALVTRHEGTPLNHHNNARSDAFEVLEHTADIGFHATAETLPALFRQAARAFFFIAIDDTRLTGRDVHVIEVDGSDYESLLVNFLQELLYLFDSGRWAPCDCEIDTLEPTRLRARVRGEVRAPERHPWKLIVKAVTYHGLEVVEREGTWHARVFLDV
jgi:SHS2 domain-containing protein